MNIHKILIIFYLGMLVLGTLMVLYTFIFDDNALNTFVMGLRILLGVTILSFVTGVVELLIDDSKQRCK